MPDTSMNIIISQSGADQASDALTSVSSGFQDISASHNQMAGLFGQRIQHIGLMMFASEALYANGLGREARMMIGLLNSALMMGSSALGPYGTAIMVAVAALGVLIQTVETVITKHTQTREELEKTAASSKQLTLEYQKSVDAFNAYIDAGGKATPALKEYIDSQELAKRATIAYMIATENLEVAKIKEKENEMQSAIAAQFTTNAYLYAAEKLLHLTTNTSGYTLQLIQMDAEVKKLTADINAQKAGDADQITALQKKTAALEEAAKATEELGKRAQETSKKIIESIKKHQEADKTAAHAAMESWRQSNEYIIHAATQVANAFNTGVAQMIVEGKNMTEVFHKMFQDMAEDIVKMILEMIEKMLVLRALMAASGMGGPIGGFATSAIASGMFKAGGFQGMVDQPTMFIAGEAGPEHVSIVPGSGNGNSDSSIGAVTVNVYGITDPRSIANEVGRQIAAAIRGQGQVNFTRS